MLVNNMKITKFNHKLKILFNSKILKHYNQQQQDKINLELKKKKINK